MAQLVLPTVYNNRSYLHLHPPCADCIFFRIHQHLQLEFSQRSTAKRNSWIITKIHKLEFHYLKLQNLCHFLPFSPLLVHSRWKLKCNYLPTFIGVITADTTSFVESKATAIASSREKFYLAFQGVYTNFEKHLLL